MQRNYCSLLEFLAFECNVLYVGKECKEHFMKVSNYFASKTIINLNEDTCRVINDLVNENRINLVVIDVGTDEFLAVDVYEKIKKIDDEISILALFNFESYEKIVRKMPRIDGYLFYPIEEDMFYRKLFMILGRIYLYNLLSVNQEFAKPDVLEDGKGFFETYKQRMLFVANDLAFNATQIKHNEDSFSIAEDSIDKINKIITVFNRNSATVVASDALASFVDLLHEIDFKALEKSKLIIYEYISDVLNFISVYLNNVFMENSIKGVDEFISNINTNIELIKKVLNR